MSLPPELYSEIINHLWNSKTALLACSIAARSFTVAAQKQLFSHIVLRGPKKPIAIWDIGGSAENFKQLLENSPHIATYVRYLEIFDTPRLYGALDTIGTEQTTEEEWLSKDTCLPFCLGLLRLLKAFVIQYRYGPNNKWSSMPEALFVAFHNLLKQPSLTYVELQYVPINLVYRSMGPNLKHVAFHDCRLDHRINVINPQIESSELTQLTSLSIESDFHILDALPLFVQDATRRFDISKLKRLVISLDDDASLVHPLVACFLQGCAATLEEFSFRPCYDSESQIFHLDAYSTDVENEQSFSENSCLGRFQ